MGLLLSFLAENIAVIIRILSVVVALASAFLLYRLIFASKAELSAAESGDQTVLAKKVSEQKAEIESLKTENVIVKTELETHRTEVYNLRQTLKEKDAEVQTIKAEVATLTSTMDAAQLQKPRDYEMHKPELILSSKDEKLLFEKEISELKRRLSDYEIIAEDIADMQKLKEENEQLKQKIGNAVEGAQAPVTEESEAPSLESMIAVESAPAKVESEESILELAGLESTLAEVAKMAATEKPPQVEIALRPDGTIVETEDLGPGDAQPDLAPDGIGESEKSLMEKFERQKGS